jgi:hypothetical protein
MEIIPSLLRPTPSPAGRRNARDTQQKVRYGHMVWGHQQDQGMHSRYRHYILKQTTLLFSAQLLRWQCGSVATPWWNIIKRLLLEQRTVEHVSLSTLVRDSDWLFDSVAPVGMTGCRRRGVTAAVYRRLIRLSQRRIFCSSAARTRSSNSLCPCSLQATLRPAGELARPALSLC